MGQTFSILLSMGIVIAIGSSVALYLGKKKKGSDNWLVGGKSLPWYVVVGTQLATAQGGGLLVANVGIGYDSGLSEFLYGWLAAFGFIFILLMSMWLRKSHFTTLPDVMKNLYGDHKFIFILTTLLTMALTLGWLGSNMIAFGRLFSELTGIPLIILMLIFVGVCLIFVLPAGLTSVAWTDFLFGALMIPLAIIVAVYTVQIAGGWDEIINASPSTNIKFPEGLGSSGTEQILLWGLALLPAPIINQMYYQRIYAIEKPKHIRMTMVIIIVLIVLSHTWATIMGITINSMNPSLTNGENAMGWLMTQLPVWLVSVYGTLVLAMIISTASSCVQSTVVNIVEDIYHTHINTKASDQKIVKLSKLMSFVVLLLIVVLASFFSGALDWIISSSAYVGAALFFPLFLGFLLRKRTFLTYQGAAASMVTGLLGNFIPHLFFGVPYYPIYGLTISGITLVVVSLIFKNKKEKKAKEIDYA